MRMSGGDVVSRRRSVGGVSPVRMPTVGCTRSGSMRASPASGLRRFRSMSAARAFRGETYRIRGPGARLGAGSDVTRRSIAHRKAANVLPDPVGATMRVSAPDAMVRHASVCTGVGLVNDSVNHRPVAAPKTGSAAGSDGTSPWCPRVPECRQVRCREVAAGVSVGMLPSAATCQAVPHCLRAAHGFLAADGPRLRRGLRPILGDRRRGVGTRRPHCRRGPRRRCSREGRVAGRVPHRRGPPIPALR